MICTLCDTKTTLFSEYQKRAFYICNNCETVLLHPDYYLNSHQEKERYDLHSDDVTAIGYQNFVKPITQNVIKNFNKNDKGLDFGCGKTEIVKYVLAQSDYNIKGFDPFYFNDVTLLDLKYNYITSCEVVEHLYNPHKVFKQLFDMLLPGGKLFLKTSLYSLDLNFEKWWYKNDPTHVTLYTKKSFEYIEKALGFSKLEISKQLIILSK